MVVTGNKTVATIIFSYSFTPKEATFSLTRHLDEVKLLTEPLELADHHIMPKFRGNKKYSEFFTKRNIDVDDFTITISSGKGGHHMKFLHGQGKWNQKWKDFIDSNPNATSKDIYQFAGKMMDEFGLGGYKIHRYKQP